jgi:hypothetical protein
MLKCKACGWHGVIGDTIKDECPDCGSPDLREA